ncbi:hypothetical protein [Scytonema sp. NUACC26]|uniref:hypothetical protein n=1 Tax=Scytonema sp. NUACC26 TaxID=3140176 RepID=UPI0034DC6BB9
MPNPKGNPESLEPYKLTTNRQEPLTAKLTVRITQSMMDKLKSINSYPDFVRNAIQKALDELEANQDT